MDKLDIKSMNREEKVELLNRIADGSVQVINGQIFDTDIAGVFFEGDKYFLDEEKTQEITKDALEKIEGPLIYLPIRKRDSQSKPYGKN